MRAASSPAGRRVEARCVSMARRSRAFSSNSPTECMGVRFSKGYELRNKNNKGLLHLVCFSGRWLKRNGERSWIFFGYFRDHP